MISHTEKRAALGLTQQDIDTAARRTATALTKETTGLYHERIRDLLSEGMARAVFEADLPEPEEWRTEAMEDWLCEWFERREEADAA